MANDKFKRVAIGTLTAIAIVIAFEALPYGLSSELATKRLGGYFYVWPAIYGLPKVFVAMFVGAYIARASFVGPAVLLSTLGWVFSIYILYEFVHATGQLNLANVVAMNFIGLLIGVSGAAVGSIAGRRFYLNRIESEVNANK